LQFARTDQTELEAENAQEMTRWLTDSDGWEEERSIKSVQVTCTHRKKRNFFATVSK